MCTRHLPVHSPGGVAGTNPDQCWGGCNRAQCVMLEVRSRARVRHNHAVAADRLRGSCLYPCMVPVHTSYRAPHAVLISFAERKTRNLSTTALKLPACNQVLESVCADLMFKLTLGSVAIRCMFRFAYSGFANKPKTDPDSQVRARH